MNTINIVDLLPKPQQVRTRRESYMEKLLEEALVDLEWIEGTTKTSEKRRSLIADIKYVLEKK